MQGQTETEGRHALTALSMCECALQVDCVQEVELCREHQITGFPSIRVFRAGSASA
jgi:hypothetical protein